VAELSEYYRRTIVAEKTDEALATVERLSTKVLAKLEE